MSRALLLASLVLVAATVVQATQPVERIEQPADLERGTASGFVVLVPFQQIFGQTALPLAEDLFRLLLFRLLLIRWIGHNITLSLGTA